MYSAAEIVGIIALAVVTIVVAVLVTRLDNAISPELSEEDTAQAAERNRPTDTTQSKHIGGRKQTRKQRRRH